MRYVSGPYTQAQLLKEITEIETALTNRYLRGGVISDAAEQRSWRERVEDASFGRNTVMYDDANHPSVMVAVPCFPEVDVLTGAANKPHPAFIVNGAVKPYIYISKYQSFTTGSAGTLRAVTLRGVDPGNSITFDNSLLACSQKGTGWHLMTNAEWAAISLLCKARGFMPRGNNNYGKDIAVAAEKAVPSFISSNLTARTATGTGPVAWSSDGSPFGIYDLNGNVYEWVGGLRLVDGEIQVLENNNAADNTKLQTVGSAEWKAILQNGSLVAPGTADTLKYDSTGTGASGDVGDVRVNITRSNNTGDTAYALNTFETVAATAGVTVPNLLKLLSLFPLDASHGGDGHYVRNNGERVACRGGGWFYGAGAGVFFLYLDDARSSSGADLGFRSAFIP